jgi:SAM-dependent methyltransferase
MALPFMLLIAFFVKIKKAIYFLIGRKPKVNSFWVDGIGKSARIVKTQAKTWRALEEIYSYQFNKPTSISSLVDNFWHSRIANCRSVRNRLVITKSKLLSEITKLQLPEVRVISLACGSAQAVIEVTAEMKRRGVVVKVVLIDIDQTALDYARLLAVKHEVSEQIQFVKGSVSRIVKISRDFQPHVVEMVGFLDYVPDDGAVRLISRIKEALLPGGVFITANITHNLEMMFVQEVMDWDMIYRTRKQIINILAKAGFQEISILAEAEKIHLIAIARA